MSKSIPLAEVPFSEPPYLLGLPSPLYKETHFKFQKACRAWFDEHFTPYALEWETEEDLPKDLFAKFCQHNMLLPNLPSPLPVKYLHQIGIKDILGTPVEEWDYVHTGIWIDEINRCGLSGPSSGLTAGYAYAIGPVIKYASKELQDKFLPDLLKGKLRTCIAITEPDAGSDVANITTTAVKSKDGKKYIVNGTKKWITNAIWSDQATMAVRTGGKGPGGLSLLIVPLKAKGVEMRRLKVTGSKTGGTTFIEMEDVEVPAENLIGEEGKGMFYVMNNVRTFPPSHSPSSPTERRSANNHPSSTTSASSSHSAPPDKHASPSPQPWLTS